MKINCFIYPVFFLPLFSFAQQVTTTENGVTVHRATGVEGIVSNPATVPANPARSFTDWTLPECIDALSAIEDKISTLGNTPEDLQKLQYYSEEKARIEERRDLLMTNTH